MGHHKYFHMRFPGFKEKTLTLSYDDGAIHDKRLIEIMTRYGIKGTFNLNSNHYLDEAFPIKAEELKSIYLDSGNEIAVHGVDHLSLGRVDDAVGAHSIVCDRENLEHMTGRIIKGMAYANGVYSDRVCEMLKFCGIKYSRTVVSTESFDMPTDWLKLHATCHHNNPRLMELAKKFIEEPPRSYFPGRRVKMFYLWGHSFEFHNNDNWHVIEQFCEYMGGRDDIWYATNAEIYDYVKAYESLEFSVLGDIVHNPTSTDVYVALSHEENLLIPAGKTVRLG